MRKYFICGIAFLSLFACKPHRQDTTQLSAANPNAKLSIEVIRQATSQPASEVKSLKEFVAWLPDYMFEPSRFVLFKETKSLCEGADNVDLIHPRVVLFDLSVPIFIAYTGKAGGSCANKVEVIQGFKPEKPGSKWRYEFYLVDFDANEKIEQEFDMCSECHAMPASIAQKDIAAGELVPIWQVFNESVAFSGVKDNSAPWPRIYAQGGVLVGEEVAQFNSFVQASKNNWPYSRLKGQFAPPGGRDTLNRVFLKLGEKSAPVPYFAAIDGLDNFFVGVSITGTKVNPPRLPRRATEITEGKKSK